MVFIAKFVAVVMTVLGCFAFMQPGIFRVMIGAAKKENMSYAVGILKAVIGIMLIVASSACRIPWLIALFGWLGVAGGILAIIIKKDITASYLKWLEEKNDVFFKRTGIAILCMGVLLIYAI